MFDTTSFSDATTVLEHIKSFVERHATIRVAILNGSRGASHATIDPFSDYDVMLVVVNPTTFVADEQWIYDVGQPIVMFRDAFKVENHQVFTRLVLYEPGVKIDYIITTVVQLQEMAQNNRLIDALDLGYRVLIDKDYLTEHLPTPSYTAHIPTKPTAEEYRLLIEEFWWESTYVAKNLWRDELVAARYSLDQVMRFEVLRKLLEWRIEIDHNWLLKPGAMGRKLKTYLAPDMWKSLSDTYVGPIIEENWAALFHLIALFRQVALEINISLGFIYPHDMDQRMMTYLHALRSHPFQ